MKPRHVLMTLDAVGGVWRYSVDLARALNEAGVRVLLVCLGPSPGATRIAEVAALPATCLVCLDEPLDWMAVDPADLDAVPERIEALADRHDVDLLHLNLPSQACRLTTRRPVVAVSHSCLVTWWQAMRASELPADWRWQSEHNRAGLARADVAIAPTRSHAAALRQAYDTEAVRVVPNAVSPRPCSDDAPEEREPFIFAAGRWWDDGKNAALLDAAAAGLPWPVRMAGTRQGDKGEGFAFRHAEWLGELSSADTRATMARAAVFASPSLYEPFGLAALEAAEAGAALVLADIPTYRELWDGAAVFTDPRDAAALRAALDGLMRDDAGRRDWAGKAKARAADFTPERQLDALFCAYQAASAVSLQHQRAES